jgi:hypothetical protein
VAGHHATRAQRVHLLGRGREAGRDPRAPHPTDQRGARGRHAAALLLARLRAPGAQRQVGTRRAPATTRRHRLGLFPGRVGEAAGGAARRGDRDGDDDLRGGGCGGRWPGRPGPRAPAARPGAADVARSTDARGHRRRRRGDPPLGAATPRRAWRRARPAGVRHLPVLAAPLPLRGHPRPAGTRLRELLAHRQVGTGAPSAPRVARLLVTECARRDPAADP